MKLRTGLLMLLALLVLAPAARAAGSTTLGLQGGLGFPIGDFTDVATLGFHVGGTGTFMVNQSFGVGGDVLWHSHGVNDDYEEALAVAAGTNVDVSLSTAQVTAHGVLLLPAGPVVRPYLKVGLGIYSSSAKIESQSGTTDESDTDVGFNIGGGVHYKGPGIGYGGELAYHYIATEGDASSMITIGALLTFGFGGL
jgi:opacity protein-like surface antigen